MATPTTSRALRIPLRHDPAAITWARETAGFSKKQLADAAGISLSLLCEIESGSRNATAPNLKKLAEVLRCPLPMLQAKDAA